MNPKAKKGLKITAIVIACIFGAILLTAVVYLLYVVIDYDRIQDDIALEVKNNAESSPSAEEYKIMTYNVGFGAYSPEYSFFMDTGVMKDGKKTKGKYGKAISKADVQKNTDGAISVIKDSNPDFSIIQEVDYNSSRSYKVDQKSAFTGLDGYGSVFAENYHSSYLFYPFTDPHGKNNAGIVTLSKYKIDDSRRYAFPIASGFSKYTDLDRCFSVTHVPMGDSTLSIISLHMSAYDKGGTIRKQQAELLKNTLAAEYEKGYYVIAGGDFNQDLLGDLDRYESEQKVPEWVFTYDEADIPEGFKIYADEDSEIGSCRGADIAWERGKTYTCMIDGFIVSDNVNVKSVKLVDTDFAYSDHNPVELTFSIG